MKMFLLEIFDPIVDFYRIRSKKEIFLLMIIPMTVGLSCYAISLFTSGNIYWDGYAFANDIVNQFITISTLFVSFSMAYLSIIVSSSSKNIEDLKGTPSEDKYMKNKEPYSLYQILVAEITYTLIFEVFFLLLCILEKFLISISCWEIIKSIVCIDVVLFVHILMMMLVVVKNIYFSFFRSQ